MVWGRGGGGAEGAKAGANCWPMAVDWHALWQYHAKQLGLDVPYVAVGHVWARGSAVI